MLLASALNGVRASAVSLLINGIRLFVFLLPGAWLGQNWGEQGSIWGCCWRTWPPDCWHGVCRHRFERLCRQGDPDGTARGSRLLFAFELPSMVLPPPRGDCPACHRPARFKRLLASLEAPICILN